MSNRNEVATLYRFVIDEVIRNIRREFVNMGVDEQVLHELQTGWNRRLLESGIFDVPPPTAAPVGMPVMMGMPTATGMRMAPSAAGVRMTPMPGSAAAAMYYYSQQQQQQIIQAQAALNGDNAVASSSTGVLPVTMPHVAMTGSSMMMAAGSTESVGKQKRHEDSDPDALNSDLDSSSDEDYIIRRSNSNASINTTNNSNNNNDKGTSTTEGGKDKDDGKVEVRENILLVLFDKVHRTRNKWRCVFREGILHLDGQEYCLNKITGEFEW